MTVTELEKAAAYLKDSEGNTIAVQIDPALWEKALALLWLFESSEGLARLQAYMELKAANDEIYEEIQAEMKWERLFADPRSDQALEMLAEEARQAWREGRTEPLDPDTL
jgi:hypothetical protein